MLSIVGKPYRGHRILMSFWRELKERSVVRVTALYLAGSWLVLQVADLVFDAYAVPAWGMRFLITMLMLGLPAAIGLSWLYEWTPQGIRRDAGGERSETRRTKTPFAVAILLALALGVFLLRPDNLAESPSAIDVVSPAAASIAVMPFANVSDEPGNDYFSDGLTSELLNLLADVPELRVMARSASFFFKGKSVSPQRVGEQLNVAHLLEGEVRKAGDQLRISVWLINTASGAEVWHETFDRTMEDIFAVQNEIAASTVDEMRLAILGEPPQSRETDPAAYEAFLLGQYFYSQRTPDGYTRAVDYLLEATATDPAFAPAWTVLSSSYSNLVALGKLPYDSGNELAIASVERALAIDPDSAMANSARAWVALKYEKDYAAAAAFFSRALRRAPAQPAILGNSAVLAVELGKLDRAIELTKRSIELNPISAIGYANLSAHLSRAGRYREAHSAADKALQLTPGNIGAQVNGATALLLSEEAVKALEQGELVERVPYRLYLQALANFSLGRLVEADAALTALTEQFSDRNGFEIACVHAWRGDTDEAFAWLERVFSDGQSYFGLKTEPLLRSLHDDRRWQPLLQKLRLDDAQLENVSI